MYYRSLKEYFAARKMNVYQNCDTRCEVKMCKISGVFRRLMSFKATSTFLYTALHRLDATGKTIM